MASRAWKKRVVSRRILVTRGCRMDPTRMGYIRGATQSENETSERTNGRVVTLKGIDLVQVGGGGPAISIAGIHAERIYRREPSIEHHLQAAR